MLMPIIDASNLTGEAREFTNAITVNGRLRASKPKDGRAAYVWRMVAFTVSPNSRHQCMPCTADFGIDCGDYNERRAICRELDKIVDQIVKAVPVTEWHGVRRWGQVFGRVGTPTATAEGAIVYR